MDIEMKHENADGSAVFTFEMQPEEMKMLMLYGLRCALELAAQKGKEWDASDDVDLEENPGLSD